MTKNRKALRAKFLAKAKAEVKEELSSRDMLMGKCARMIEGLDEVIHILTEKLVDAFRIYFPEIPIKDRDKLVKVIAIMGKRENPNLDEISEIIGKDRAELLAEQGKHSIGAELSDQDLALLKATAEEIIHLKHLKEQIIQHLEQMGKEVCPNITHLLGPALTAKLIAHAKSVKRLALMPASTIQVLGAEKALFKHLRSKRRVKPPKHGLIFQHAKICGSPKRVRGKIARALATKIAMAAKADAFTGHFIADKLKEEFEARYNEIMEQFHKNKGKR